MVMTFSSFSPSYVFKMNQFLTILSLYSLCLVFSPNTTVQLFNVCLCDCVYVIGCSLVAALGLQPSEDWIQGLCVVCVFWGRGNGLGCKRVQLNWCTFSHSSFSKAKIRINLLFPITWAAFLDLKSLCPN